MCSYTVALRDLVDLRQLHHGAPWDELWHDWREDWRHLMFELHIEPPTWVLADLVLAHGYTGILFPSQAREGGTNVVVYSDRLKGISAVYVTRGRETGWKNRETVASSLPDFPVVGQSASRYNSGSNPEGLCR